MDAYEVKSGSCLLELDTESPENRVRAWLDGLSGVQKFLDQEAQSDITVEHTEGCTSGEAAVCDRALIEIDCGNRPRNEQERKADNNSENSSSSSEGYSAITTYGRPYTDDECEAMILYIMDNEAHSLTGGNMLWKKMQAEKVCERSWQSMRTCFRKKILPNIGQYRLQEKEAKKFSDILQPSPKKVSITMKPGERGWRRNTNFYVKEDDEKILEYLLHRNRFCSVGGVVLWKKMENKNIVPGRSWQSMKSRYLNIILPNVHVYNLNEDCVNKLKQKKGYGNVKKKTKKEILQSHDKPTNNNNSPSKSFISEEKRQNFRKRAVLTGLSLAEQLRQTKALQLVPQDVPCGGLPLNWRETVNTASNNNKNLSQVHKSHSDISKGEEVSARKNVSKKKLYVCVTKWNENENEITISSEQESTSLNKLHASSGELAISNDSTASSLKRKLTTQPVPTKHLCQNDRAQISIGESESENQDKIVAHTLPSSQNPEFALSPMLELSGSNQLKEISVDLICQIEESEGYATDHEEDVNAERQISETSHNLHARNVLVPTKSGTDKRDNGGVSSDCGCETFDSFQHSERGSKNHDNGDESIRELQEQQMPSPHSLSSHRTEPATYKHQDISPVLAQCSVEPVLKMSQRSSPHLELYHELSLEQCIDQQTKDNTGKQYNEIVNLCDEVHGLDATENSCDERVSHKLSKRRDDGDHYKELKVSHDLDNVKHAKPNDSKVLDGMLNSHSSLDCDTSPSPRCPVNLNKNKNSEERGTSTNSHTSKIVADIHAVEILERGIGGSSESFDPFDFCENNKRKNTHATFGRQDVSNSYRGKPGIKEVAHACFGPCTCNMQTCDLTESQENAFLEAKEGNVYTGDEGFSNVNMISPRIIEKELITCEEVPRNLDYDLSADLPNNSSQDASRSSCGTLQLREEDPSEPILENAIPNQRNLTSFSEQGPIQTSTPRIIFPINEKNLSHKVDPSPSITLDSDAVECEEIEPNANTASHGIVDTCDSECPSMLLELTCHERMTESENSLKMCACLENLGQGRVCAVGRHDSSVHSASTEVCSDNGEQVVCSTPNGDFSSDTTDVQYKLISQEALNSEHLDGNSDVGIDSTSQASTDRVQLPQNDFLHNTQEATYKDISEQNLNLLSDEEDLAEDLILRIDDSGGESPTHLCHAGKKHPCGGCSRCYGSMSPVSD